MMGGRVSDSVAIIILNYNTYDLTIECIKSINSVIKYDNFEIIVVDNASTNDSVNILKEWNHTHSLFKLIVSPQNNGYAAGNNIGISYAINNNFRYVLIINNDILFKDPLTINKLLMPLQMEPNVGVTSPKLVSMNGTPDPPIYYRKPTFHDLTWRMFSFYKKRFKEDDSIDKEVYAPRGSCMMLSAKILQEIDYLDEKTFLYYEEPILAERLLKIGKVSYHCGTVSVIHNHAKTIKSNVTNSLILCYICESLSHYLKVYRMYNSFQIKVCVFFKKLSYKVRNR